MTRVPIQFVDQTEPGIQNPYGYIYCTVNLINNVKYLGQHVSTGSIDAYLGSGKAFLNAVKKYGSENFSKHILQWARTKEELDDLERKYIELTGAVESKDYYNIQAGGGSWARGQMAGEKNPMYGVSLPSSWKGKHHTEHSKQLMRGPRPSLQGKNNPNYGNGCKIAGERNYMYGKHLTNEQKYKLSVLRTGTHVTDNTKQKISLALKGRRCGEENPFYGKHHTKETKQKILESQKSSKKFKDSHYVKVVQYTTSGELVKVWDCIADAQRAIGRKWGIGDCCRGYQKTCGGFVWKYLDETK